MRGSSPRGRGKPSASQSSSICRGLIPAWAGKTGNGQYQTGYSQAHPRVGGENKTSGARSSSHWGSSPRGRGKRLRWPQPWASVGLIPAWAGKTGESQKGKGRTRAHPRVGGENIATEVFGGIVSGSSPRGRGKHQARVLLDPEEGLIPAWAGKTSGPSPPRPRRRAHPRVGGENSAMPAPRALSAGSSPRGRGKREQFFRRFDHEGLIPAWAGKTQVSNPKTAHSAAHPRVGGENFESLRQSVETVGSSPRGRGKLCHSVYQLPRLGLIPAWAGKTARAASAARTGGAHPRVGGENGVPGAKRCVTPGSSPRGRGKPAPGPALGRGPGLIPAWAGKTSWTESPKCPSRAHPRVGGENQGRSYVELLREGSSPRGRGKLRAPQLRTTNPRLIPAWAGKTARTRGRAHRAPAHPRVGGENSTGEYFGATSLGSSPRGRGKPPRLRLRDSPRGLIPAWAGKTGPRPQRTWIPGAHPRVGGENAEPKRDPLGVTGSSPRGRGKPWPGRCATRSRRLIPAWAGKTLRLEIVYGWYAGSSPRGRGKHAGVIEWHRGGRLIPAWAGKTSSTPGLTGRAGAHPRVGGENDGSGACPRARAGSSPRGRGKRRPPRRGTCRARLIPAWAGKTPSWTETWSA